jgi:hypothetical protein
MHDLRSGRLQFFVDVSTNANVGTPALQLRTATKDSLVDLNLVMLDLTLSVLLHNYTDRDLFDLIHYKQYPIVTDLAGIL